VKQIVRCETVAEAFSNAGIATGSRVLVHSSLSSLGHVDGGADAVIDGILDVIGGEGTLMVPTFNYWAVELFDPDKTPGLTGVITETLRHRRGAVRSLHPTHSVAAIGKHAAEFVSGHEFAGALRVGSPIDKLAKAGGFTVLLGVRHEANSTIHVGEAYAEPWYLGFPFTPKGPSAAKVLVGDRTITVPLAGFQSGCSLAFNAIELPLRRHGEIIDFKIGGTLCQLIPTQAIIDRTVDLVEEREDILLCSWAGCFFCANARKQRPVKSMS
jgi:aminoglycoside 3-N-acetyltransferase